MGTRHPRPQPDRLASKLGRIRATLGYTLEEMANALKGAKKSPPSKGHVHRFETGQREPSLLILLEYTRIAGVPLETLVDDDLELPGRLPEGAGGKRSKGTGRRRRGAPPGAKRPGGRGGHSSTGGS